MAVSLRYCKLSNCYQRANWDCFFGNGTGFGGATAPNLCGLTIGDTTAITFSATGGLGLPFSANLSTCGQNSGFTTDVFDVSLSVTPSW